mgnify:CR=1 FL=1|jgi:hypothetical protein|tara:strand:- start:203 stop:499 length:297 start_codon:yes stop_codon:yes gene_type:complete
MKKIILICVLLLILFTSQVKNSTKEIEKKIFAISKNIRLLEAEVGDVMLEYNYLSSPEKLIQHQSYYFENDLIKIDVTKIKKIEAINNQLKVTDFINK